MSNLSLESLCHFLRLNPDELSWIDTVQLKYVLEHAKMDNMQSVDDLALVVEIPKYVARKRLYRVFRYYQARSIALHCDTTLLAPPFDKDRFNLY